MSVNNTGRFICIMSEDKSPKRREEEGPQSALTAFRALLPSANYSAE
jgi:hypothetical protein